MTINIGQRGGTTDLLLLLLLHFDDLSLHCRFGRCSSPSRQRSAKSVFVAFLVSSRSMFVDLRFFSFECRSNVSQCQVRDELSSLLLRWNVCFSLFICPSSCFTRRYLNSHAEYPVYGNESYSGVSSNIVQIRHFSLFSKNSVICKSAWHSARLSVGLSNNVTLFIRNSSTLSNVFPSVLRNGILSSKFVSSLCLCLLEEKMFVVVRSSSGSSLVYQFVNPRLNGRKKEMFFFDLFERLIVRNVDS